MRHRARERHTERRRKGQRQGVTHRARETKVNSKRERIRKQMTTTLAKESIQKNIE